MALTSDEVNKQSFKIERKGYDVNEVDAFLEHVATEVDGLNAQIAQLQEQLEQARREQRPSAPAEPAATATSAELDQRDLRIRQLEAQIAEHKAEDSAIAQALIIAQRSADEIIANANGAAETTRQDAADEAQRILDKANAEKQRVLDQIKKLEDDREAARDRFSDMLNDFIGNSQDILSDLQAGKAGSRGGHTLPSVSTTSSPSTTAANPYAVGDSATAAYTTPTVSSSAVVTPATPKPSKVEKDFSGFGDTDDGFEFDDVD